MASISSENHELQLARDFVEHTGSHVFLTGKAGTGKTTFLHNLRGNTAKQMIVTAPTGVAAINAGGVTLHSFFQLPFGPFIPGSEDYEKNRQRLFRFSKEKIQIIKNLDLLVIDEISMVRADLLDAVDAALRYHRQNELPFGGVQLLMIGDLHQLSPVAKQDEWQLLQQYYSSVYFFSGHALGKTELVTIELKHIYRQSDARFIQLLNRVRDNRINAAAIEELNRRYIENYNPEEDQCYITLTTHNRNADTTNNNRLEILKGKEYRFKAEISGDFPEHTYPSPGVLVLKPQAQVMFLRNDSSTEKRYFNGKIGKIKTLSSECIHIICPGESETIVVEPVEWKNIKYSLDEEKKEIQEDVIGTFKQFPLKLAWAITIHKSQGLTFDKAVIDAQSAFAHGQVYVALSRCKTFEGMVLSSPIPSRGFDIDDAVLRYVEIVRQNPPSENRLQTAKRSYQQQLLLMCFDFQQLHHRFNDLVRLLLGNSGRIHVSGIPDIGRLQQIAQENIFEVGEKFKQQLLTLFDEESLPASNAFILERISKASVWFQDKLSLVFNDLIHNIQVETDNKDLGKRIGDALNALRKEIRVKLAGIGTCEKGFSPSMYLRAISAAALDSAPEKRKKLKTPVYGESDIEHPELFQNLKDWRSRKAKEQGLPHFQILHQRLLIQIAVSLPDNKADLENIKGMGKRTLGKYGEELLSLVRAYRKKHGIDRMMPPAPKEISSEKSASEKAITNLDTRQISFDLFNKGFAIDHIAKERGLVESTIQGHLCYFIENGRLDINRLLSSEKQNVIEAALAQVHNNSLKSLKKELGDDYTYGDIKLVIARQRYVASK